MKIIKGLQRKGVFRKTKSEWALRVSFMQHAAKPRGFLTKNSPPSIEARGEAEEKEKTAEAETAKAKVVA